MIQQNGTPSDFVLSPEKERLQKHFLALVRKIDAHFNGSPGGKLIGVTGPDARQGVSSVAMNLALAASRLESRKVLIVDSNYDRPTSNQLFGVRRSPGFSDLLENGADIDHALQPLSEHRLSVVSVGSPRTKPFEREQLVRLTGNLRRTADWVVVDLAPADGVSDVGHVASLLDGVIVVVRSGGVETQQAQRAVERLRRENANVIGIVLNEHGK